MKKLYPLFPVLIFFILSSCSTEIDLNAPYKNIPVVYSLLNVNDTAHYVRVNKAFLGEDDAFVMAASHDSIYYDTARVYLSRYQITPELLLSEVELTKTYLPKDTGIFNSDSNFVYKTETGIVAATNSEYRLRVEIPGKAEVNSITSLISGLTIVKPGTNEAQKIGFGKFGTNDLPEYYDYECEWRSTLDARLYGLTLRFYWKEIYSDGNTAVKWADWELSTIKSTGLLGGEKMYLDVSGEGFFLFVANNVTPGDPSTKRVVQSLDFIFTVAGDDLATYIEVNGPSNGIVQERPAFTNISGGVGIFSSRFNKTIPGKKLSPSTIDLLSCGSLTKHLRFSDQSEEWDCINH